MKKHFLDKGGMMFLKKIFIYIVIASFIGLSLYAQDKPATTEGSSEGTVQSSSEVKTEESKTVQEEKKEGDKQSEEKKEDLKKVEEEKKDVTIQTVTTPQPSSTPTTSEGAQKKEFFTGSAIGFGNSFGINPDNPLSTLSMKLLPKFNLPWTNFFYLSGRIDISKEVTNSDTTSYLYETQLSDARLEFVFPELYREKFTDIGFSGTFRISFPTSKASQYATLRWGNMIDLGISKGFFGEKGKPETQKVFLGYDFRFYKNWHKYTTSEIEESSGGYYKQYPLRVKAPEYLNSGITNLEYQVAHIFSSSISISEKLSFVGYFWVINGWAYELYSGGKRGTRDSIDFNIELDYQLYKWFVVGLGLDTFQPQLLPNSTYTNNPFWRNTYDNYTTLYIDVTFIL